MFLFGPPNVKEMKARRDVNGLIRALGYILLTVTNFHFRRSGN
jgi:hypothetical protein